MLNENKILVDLIFLPLEFENDMESGISFGIIPNYKRIKKNKINILK